jgi:phosphate-selective porin OprO/OprP
MGRLVQVLVVAVLLWVLFASAAWADAPSLVRQPVVGGPVEWQSPDALDFKIYWKSGGPVFTAADGKFQFNLHGRIMADFTFFGDADRALEEAIDDEFHSGFQFRRVWWAFTGKITDYVGWMVQLALENEEIPYLDVWVRIQNLDACLGCLAPDIKLGHYQEPIGLAWLTSSKYFQLTAWPLPTTTFTPGYNTGVTLHSTAWGERATAQLGYFLNSSDLKGLGRYRDGHAFTGRVTWLPWVDCDSDCKFLHLGAGASYRFDLDSVRFRSRPDLDLGPFVVDTGGFSANSSIFVDLEAALVFNRFSVQAEGMWVHVDAEAGTDPDFWGWYVQLSYLIGADCRRYSRTYGTFTGVRPCKSFDCTDRSWGGSWELVLRLDGVDLDSGDKQGGKCNDVVLGVNYALNANARIMLNFVRADVRNAHGGRNLPFGDGAVNAAVIRFQVNW